MLTAHAALPDTPTPACFRAATTTAHHSPALRPAPEALKDGPLVGVRLGHVQLALLRAAVVLGVGGSLLGHVCGVCSVQDRSGCGSVVHASPAHTTTRCTSKRGANCTDSRTHALECAQDVLARAVGHVLHHEDGVLKAAPAHHVQHAAHLLAVGGGAQDFKR